MAIDPANSGRYVFYLNFRELGTGDNFCEAEQNFSFAELVDDASKFICSVERFRIPLQSIPQVNAIPDAVTFNPKGGSPLRTLDTEESYSLNEFLQQMNEDAALTISLTADGRAQIDFDFTNFSLTLDPVIAEMFDMGQVLGLNLTGAQTIIGASPIFDRVDQLFKIQIEGLSGFSAVQQEIIDTNVFRNLLTDFLIPSTYSMSAQHTTGMAPTDTYNLNYTVRQDLEFNMAANRRYIMFRSSSPIQNVRIEITAIYRDGSRHRIRMPKRSVLEVKVAFWRK